MKKLVIALIVISLMCISFISGGLTSYYLVIDNQTRLAKNSGHIDGALQVYTFLDKHFHGESQISVLSEEVVDNFSIKDASIYVKRVNGELRIETQ